MNLHHDPVPRLEDMVRIGQGEAVALHLPPPNRIRMLEAVPIPPAENIRRDRQLIAPHLRLARHFIRKHIDQLHHPIRIRARRRRHQIRNGRAADPHRRFQLGGLINKHIRAVGGRPLIRHQPRAPPVAVIEPHRPRDIRHRFRQDPTRMNPSRCSSASRTQARTRLRDKSAASAPRTRFHNSEASCSAGPSGSPRCYKSTQAVVYGKE